MESRDGGPGAELAPGSPPGSPLGLVNWGWSTVEKAHFLVAPVGHRHTPEQLLITHDAARGRGGVALNGRTGSMSESGEQADQHRHNAMGDQGGIGCTVHEPTQEAVESQAPVLDIIAEMKYRLDTLSMA